MSRFILKPLTALILILKIFLAPSITKTEEFKLYCKKIPETPFGLYQVFNDEPDDNGSLPYTKLFSFMSDKNLHPNPTLESILHHNLVQSNVNALSRQLENLSPPNIPHIAALAYVLKEPVLYLTLDKNKISWRSFLVNNKRILPLASLGGSMEPVPKRQFLQTSTLRYIEVCPENTFCSYPLGDYLQHFFYRAEGTSPLGRAGKSLVLTQQEMTDDCVQVGFFQPASLKHILDTFALGQYLKLTDLDASKTLKSLFDNHKMVLMKSYHQLKTMTIEMQQPDLTWNQQQVTVFDRFNAVRDLSQETAAILTSCIPTNQSKGFPNPLKQNEIIVTSTKEFYLSLNQIDRIILHKLVAQKLCMGQRVEERGNLKKHSANPFNETVDIIPFNQENPIHFLLANLYLDINIFQGLFSCLTGFKTVRMKPAASHEPQADISHTITLIENECDRLTMLAHALMLLYFPLHFTESGYQPLAIIDDSFVVFDSKAFPPKLSGWLYSPTVKNQILTDP